LPGFRIPGSRRRRDERERRRRSSSAIWALFWIIVLIVLLGLIFGGYRKGTQVNNPGSWIRVGTGISSSRR
jgi:cell division protein FtsW (lipid II flippase)